ncbi:MAG TPA: M24 family metallopeptidase [Pyrinomonadaceae bacterium]|jgi:Xaa-Pro aminopeptidase|nr:M24 family metallopeptidase [Pyrinomonadaceae bacterium]
MKKIILTFWLLFLLLQTCTAVAQNKSWEKIPAMPKLLSQRQQINVRESWLKKRFDTILLPMMKRHKVDMWIVVNEEFHSDPVTEFIVPPIPIVGRRDFFVFIDKGDKLERYAVVRYEEERLKNHYTLLLPPRDGTAAAIKKLVEDRDPKTIALNFKGSRGATSGLTYDAYQFLADAVGNKYEKRFVSATPLITDYLDTRIPDELEHYRTAVLATDVITRRAFSNEVITPGKTTVGDVRWWMMQQLNDIGVTTWFQADLRVQRRAKANQDSRQFLAVADEAMVIERGDVIHVDFGLIYMGLSTDWQKMGYILQKGEKDAPAGLKAALKNTNRLQDILFSFARPGMTGAEVYDKTMAECKKQGIQAMIYSHPLGAQGHGLGASIDFRRGAIGGDEERFRLGSYMSIELNTSTAVPEWGGQSVTIMAEDDAHMTESGYQWFRPRQTEFYLIR